MKVNPLKILSGYRPLLYWKGQLLLARGYDLMLADYNLEQLTHLVRLPVGAFKRLIARMRLTRRLFRLGVGPTCNLNDCIHCLICNEGVIFKLNMNDGTLVQEFVLPRARKLLQFTQIDVTGFAPGVYFGEYFNNPEKEEVRIYYRSELGHWSTAYTFAAGEINHIHRIVQDSERQCLYVLTGDFGDAAAIWEVRKYFTHVARIGAPGQNSRTCWLKVTKDRLVYATDTQLEPNHLNCICIKGSSFGSPHSLQPIAGSSIYCLDSTSDKLIFSTVVEPDEVHGNKYLAMFSTRRGPGILTDNAYIYVGYANGQALPVFYATKDSLPFRLFQFGSFQFPAGSCDDENLIHIYGTAVTGMDGCTVLLKLPERKLHEANTAS